MKIKISPQAEKELDESVEYYDAQKEGLGTEFAKEVNETFKRIKENPKQFPKEYKSMQKGRIARFSFNIFFVVKDVVGYILGIFHSSRDPEIIKERYDRSK